GSVTAVAPTGAAYGAVNVHFLNPTGSLGRAIVGGAMAEESASLNPLIVGDTSLDPALDSSWTGTAYASTTEAYAAGLPYPSADAVLRQNGEAAGMSAAGTGAVMRLASQAQE